MGVSVGQGAAAQKSVVAEEQSYRAWAKRFARFMASDLPWKADASHVDDFLTQLAVEEKVEPSTQKQALNALVFFLHGRLHPLRTTDLADGAGG